VFHRFSKSLARLIKITANPQQAIDLGPVLGPLLNFVEIAFIRMKQVVGFFAGPFFRAWMDRRA
jgi:hypothetical protein